MSMFNDIELERKDANCVSDAEKSQELRDKQDSRKDTGHAWVQGRKRSGMDVLLTLTKDSGILQPSKWYSDSKKLVIPCSEVQSRNPEAEGR